MAYRPGSLVILLAFIFGYLSAVPVQAQIRYDLSAGPNFTSLSTGLDDVQELGDLDYDMTVGFYASLGLGFDVGPLDVHSGLTYINAGAIFDGSTFLDRDDFAVNFIAIPVDLRLGFPVAPLVRPYLLAGGEGRFRLDISGENFSFEDNLKRQSLAASIGAGVTFSVPVVGVSLSPEVRYAIDIEGLTEGDVTVEEEVVRIRDEFKAHMLRFGLVVGL